MCGDIKFVSNIESEEHWDIGDHFDTLGDAGMGLDSDDAYRRLGSDECWCLHQLERHQEV